MAVNVPDTSSDEAVIIAKVDVVFEHDDWLLLNKPAGFSVQELAAAYQPQFSEFHPVHRLDKDTTGLWLVAKNAMANSLLSQAFEQQNVTKHYLALTHSSMKKKQGKVIGDMQKSRRGQWQLLRSKNHPAITQFISASHSSGKRLVLCSPRTGKTHQIRVAMKSNGAAILGDSRYDLAKSADYDRLYLHAYKLAFDYQGKHYEFSQLPNSGEYFMGEKFHNALVQLVSKTSD